MLSSQHHCVILRQLMGDSRHKRKYAGGALKQVTPEWKSAVVAALKELGQTKTWLSEQIGCDKSALTVMLRPATTVSRLVDPICAVLKIAPPLVGADVDQSDVIAMVGALDDKDRALAIDFIRRLRR